MSIERTPEDIARFRSDMARIAQHTPTPWLAILSSGETDWMVADFGEKPGSGMPIARIENYHGNAKDNAAFIVRAVNSHDDLIEVAQMAASSLKVYETELMTAARAALKKARQL